MSQDGAIALQPGDRVRHYLKKDRNYHFMTAYICEYYLHMYKCKCVYLHIHIYKYKDIYIVTEIHICNSCLRK